IFTIRYCNKTYQAPPTETQVPLKVGMNVLRWQIVPVADRIRPSGSSSASKSSSIIAIHSMEVSGIPYVYSCQSCHPGYSSAIGAPKCSKCQANTYSTSATELPGLSSRAVLRPRCASCKPKPACAASDYALFYAQSPCTVANNYQVTRPSYNWIQPKVCDAGVSLPSNSGAGGNSNLPASCKGVYCNPGMRAAAANGEKDPLQCEACPEGQYSDGNSTCAIRVRLRLKQKRRNPQSQSDPDPLCQVVHEYVASNWLVTPPLMNLSCLVLQVDGSSTCSEQAWQLMGDRVQTAPTRTRHSRVLTLDLPGFHQPQGAQQGDDTSASFAAAAAAAAADVTPVGSLIIDFEYESRRHVEIKTWAGSQKRSQFKYIIRRTDRHKFFLIFEPAPFIEDNESAAGSAASTGESVDWSRNVLTVYSVRAPNALGSGGVRCQACPLGIQGNKCIPCPAGKYYDSKNITCYPCPTGQVVAKHPAEGVNSCAPCPAGMRALDGVACVLNPKGPKQSDHLGGPEFDFTNLLSPGQYYLARGAKLFTGRGNQYTHVYNVSLTAGTKAKCESNATKLADKSVESFVCRVTIVPNHGNSSLTLAALPNSFADRLVNATNSEQSPGAEAMLKASGWKSDPDKMDTHIFFESDYTTEVCSKHRVTLVTLRCDPKAATPLLSLPPNCPDGTCDGCNFHLLMEAKEACKLCQTKDYERVNGECVMGKQTVHMYPPKRCYLPGGEPTKKTQVVDCPLVNKPVGIVMVVVLFIGFLSLALACHCYRKNKTLQYKYMQLVESKEGELPGVESCAVNEGDDEDDDDNRFRGAGNDDGELDVSVRGGRRSGGGGAGGSAVLSKLKRSILPSAGGRRDRGGGSNVEHLNLTEQMDDLSL
uniref:MRH domain-containing protein n=1 Tax=Macrostomum lignano TaxID=282301 RepID=A0A1I8IQH8_9PLAT